MKFEGLTMNQLAERNAVLVQELEKAREVTNCPQGVDLQDHLKQLVSRCDALTAENVGLREYRPQPSGVAMMEALDAFYEYHEDVPEQGMMAAFEILCCKRPVMPATDSILRAAEARGVDMFAAKLRIPGDDPFFDAVAEGVAGAAAAFANQLREGKV